MLRRIFAPILTFILIVGVDAAIYMSASEQFSSMNVELAKGLSGSEKIKQDLNLKKSFQPFFTPMVIASWKPIAEILIENNIRKFNSSAMYLSIASYVLNNSAIAQKESQANTI